MGSDVLASEKAERNHLSSIIVSTVEKLERKMQLLESKYDPTIAREQGVPSVQSSGTPTLGGTVATSAMSARMQNLETQVNAQHQKLANDLETEILERCRRLEQMETRNSRDHAELRKWAVEELQRFEMYLLEAANQSPDGRSM